jgi:uncharacterized protein
MLRAIESNLHTWLLSRNRKPLIIRGARQVGKSTLVRNFALSQNLILHEVNLEKHPQLKPAFESNSSETILQEIQLVCRCGALKDENALLFIDEVQSIPAALTALRYLYEDRPKLAIICAGSLMEFTLGELRQSMPVGRVEYLFMGPLSFEEFLQAAGEQDLLETMRAFQSGAEFPATAHRRLIEWQRLFLLIGGMPEAADSYLATKDFDQVASVHASIANTYRDDFAKYARGHELVRLQKVFDYVPLALGRKVKYVKIDREMRAAELRKAIDLLHKAQVIALALHTDASGMPLPAGVDETVFKPYFLDCGLAHYLSGNRIISLEQIKSRSFINEGPLAEQFVAQHLLYFGDRRSRPALYYWLREGRSANAEVDFVIGVEGKVIPVEVKAGESGSLKSLHQFIGAKGQRLAVRLDLNPPSMQRVSQSIPNFSSKISFDLMSLPTYMVEQLPRLLSK